MYTVCFYLDCLSLSQMVNKRADLLLKVDLFLFQNPYIISHCVILSTPKIFKKYFILLLDRITKPVIITRGLIL